MGTVTSYGLCDRCGGTYIYEADSRTKEANSICIDCGRIDKYVAITDNNGEAVLDDDGNMIFKHSCEQGFGCIYTLERNGGGSLYRLTKPVDDELKKDFFELIEKPEVIKESCYLTSWDEKEKRVVVVYGRKKTESFDEE